MSTQLSEAPFTGNGIPFGLEIGEIWWRRQYDMLRKHGYELRPRFRPEWTPSWVAKKKDPMLCEDGFPSLHPKVIDAIRISDKQRVAIKKLRKGSDELRIARYLASPELRDDPRNHTVPIIDVFSEEYDTLEFMVMPLLLMFNDPPFNSVDEVLDFIRQTLEGLCFMHEKGVAHRDCSVLNIMMDGAVLYPRGFHPGCTVLNATAKGLANPRCRRDVPGVKYYFTDFGISSQFEDPSVPRLVTGEDCQDRELPEIHQDAPYVPFPVDIFLLGNVFKRSLVAKYENLDFLAPLCHEMTQRDPNARPTADASLRLFTDVVKKHSPQFQRRLLVYRDADRVDRFFADLGTFKHEVLISIMSCLRASCIS